MQEPNRRQRAAEVRLLLATIVISAVALLLLARLRFPQPTPVPQLTITPPLERLAASATYDELARIVASVQTRIAPSLLPLRLARQPLVDLPLDAGELSMQNAAPRLTAVIRIGDTVGLAYIAAPGSVPDRLLGTDAPAEVIAVDEIRGLTALRVPHGPAIVPRTSLRQMVEVPAYFAIGEPTAAGAALRPVFIGRADPITDSRWRTTLYSLGMQAAAPGTPLFSLTGEFVGLLVSTSGGTALIAAQDLLAAAAPLQRGESVRRGRLGFAVQPMTTALAAATGATAGVVVALVEPDGPASGLLRVGDVIEAVGETPARDLDTFLMLASPVPAGATVTFTVLRDGVRSQVSVATAPAGEEPEDRSLGMTLRTLRGTGAEVVLVSPRGAAARAGIRTGDVLTDLNGVAQPTAEAITRAWAAGRAPLVLGVRRGAQPLVIAIPVPGSTRSAAHATR